MKRRSSVLLVVMLGMLLTLMPTVIAQDDPETTPEPEMTAEATPEMDTSTYVRFAHFAPGVDGVDIFVDDTMIDEANLTYPGITEWMAVDAGSYDVDVTPTGDTVDNAVISADDVEVGPGFVTVVVVAGENDQPATLVISENRDDLLPGTSGLTLMNALSSDTPVNFDRDDVPFVTELSAQGNRALYSAVDSGTYTFRAYNPFAEGEGTFGETTEIDLIDGSYYLIAVVGTEDEAQLFIEETTGAEYAMVSGMLEEPGTILDAIRSRTSIAGYADVIESAGLAETLSGEGTYTVFLPAEYLMDEIQASAGDDSAMLSSTLENHVVDGNLPLGQLTDTTSVTTLGGNSYDVTIEGNSVFVGGMQVLRANIFATNGVIHVIDGILGETETTE